MNKFDRIIQILSLVGSDTRTESISKLIEYILLISNSYLDKHELKEYINLEFNIELDEQGFEEALQYLLDKGRARIEKNYFILEDDIKDELKLELANYEKEQLNLYKDFNLIINDISGGEKITEDDRKKVFSIFLNYLYECFYSFGRYTIDFFKSGEKNNEVNRAQLVSSAISKIENKEIVPVFKEFLKIYPNKLTSDQISYLEQLAERSENFFSLGLSKEMSEHLKDLNIIDWTLYLDTNFLYSVLDLREHPENEACKQIIKLVKENKQLFKIKFKYLPETFDELKKTKTELEENLSKQFYSKSQINALLKSGNIDSFSESYLKKMHQFGAQTPHPADLISKATTILKESYGIEVDRKEYKSINLESEHFRQLISDFKGFESIRNEARKEKNLQGYQIKDIPQLDHDLYLREIVISLRNYKAIVLNDVKYFGVTLDRKLIDFDKYQIRKETKVSDYIIPTFFLPSFLLSRLTKFLPVKTDDYKRAFIKAIASPVFSNKATRFSSQTSIKTVAYFNAMGIDNERLMLNFITDDHFLKEFSTKNSNPDELKTFVESTLGKKFTELEDREKNLTKEIEKFHKIVSDKEKIVKENDLEIQKLNARRDQLVSDISIFKKEISKLTKQDSTQSKAIKQLTIFNTTEINKPLSSTNVDTEAPSVYQQGGALPVETNDETIINWSLLNKKLILYIHNFSNTFFKTFVILNLAFSVFYIILGAADFSRTEAYFLIGLITGAFEGFLGLLSEERIPKKAKIIFHLIIFLINLIYLLSNFSLIVDDFYLVYTNISKFFTNLRSKFFKL